MKKFPLAYSRGMLPNLINVLLFILAMFFGPTYQLLAAACLCNSIFFYLFWAESIRSRLLLSGITDEEQSNENK